MTVLAVILLIIALILWFPVRIGIAYGEAGASGWLKVLFWKIPLFPSEKTEEETEQTSKQKHRKSKKKSKAGKKDSADEYKPSKKKKKTLWEWIELILLIAQSGGRIARRFWKGFRINDLSLQMAVAGSDAAQTAITYGRINGAVYTAYPLLSRIITLNRSSIRIVPDFLSEKSRIEASGELFFRVGTLLVALFSGGFYFLKGFLAMSKEQKTKKKLEAAGQTDEKQTAACL